MPVIGSGSIKLFSLAIRGREWELHHYTLPRRCSCVVDHYTTTPYLCSATAMLLLRNATQLWCHVQAAGAGAPVLIWSQLKLPRYKGLAEACRCCLHSILRLDGRPAPDCRPGSQRCRKLPFVFFQLFASSALQLQHPSPSQQDPSPQQESRMFECPLACPSNTLTNFLTKVFL